MPSFGNSGSVGGGNRKKSKKVMQEVRQLRGFRDSVFRALREAGYTVSSEANALQMIPQILSGQPVEQPAPALAVTTPSNLAPSWELPAPPAQLEQPPGLDLDFGLDPEPEAVPAQTAPQKFDKVALAQRVKDKLSRSVMVPTGRVGPDGQPIYRVQVQPEAAPTPPTPTPAPTPSAAPGHPSLASMAPLMSQALRSTD